MCLRESVNVYAYFRFDLLNGRFPRGFLTKLFCVSFSHRSSHVSCPVTRPSCSWEFCCVSQRHRLSGLDVSRVYSALAFKGWHIHEESMDISPHEDNTRCCLETSDTSLPVTLRHIPEERKPQLPRCESLESLNVLLWRHVHRPPPRKGITCFRFAKDGLRMWTVAGNISNT
jgi:hypothetical protein